VLVVMSEREQKEREKNVGCLACDIRVNQSEVAAVIGLNAYARVAMTDDRSLMDGGEVRAGQNAHAVSAVV